MSKSIKKISLSMSSNFHTSVDFWLDLPISELYDWSAVAGEIIEEERQRTNTQRISPGL